MVYIEITDGLGNQLYRYATAYAVAKLSGKKLVVDSSYMATSGERIFELDKLKLKWDSHICWRKKGVFNKYCLNYIRKYKALNNVHYFIEDSKLGSCQNHDSIIDLAKSVDKLYLKGYFQNYRLFDSFKNEISAMIEPVYSIDSSASLLLSKIRSTESVSVHLRRGDYVKLGFVLDDNYYNLAINEITRCVNNPVFYVFSDDIVSAKEFIEQHSDKNMVLVEYKPIDATIEDLYLMKCCKHQIIANSSYSWWGGYANSYPDKVVIAPDGKLDKNRNKLHPENWIVVNY